MNPDKANETSDHTLRHHLDPSETQWETRLHQLKQPKPDKTQRNLTKETGEN